VVPLHLIIAVLFGWLEREQRDAIEFLREENRVLKAQLQGRRLRLNDDQRRRLAVIGQRLGRRILADVATIVTPDTILRWHRELIVRKWTYARTRPGRPGVHAEIHRLVVRMATENPSWGYTRIQGALKNLGHRVARSTIAKILKEQGIPPSRERPITWRAFLRAHWRALLAADFFTTEVWTVRGLVTYYTVFVIELHSRRVHVLGSTPHPDEAFVVQTMRHLTDDVDGVLRGDRMLICDRDRKWSTGVERFLATAGIRVIRTPFLAPNCNAHAERFVRSIREECLNRVIPLGERHLRRTLGDFVAHYHGERNHQGLSNELIDRPSPQRATGPVRRRERVGGLLSYYYRAAA
jgi:putative transposase